MTTSTELSDTAMAVFAFALYHQLSSGVAVSGVIASDDAGHKVDPQAVTELSEAGLANLDGDMVVFTEEGLAMLETLGGKLRG